MTIIWLFNTPMKVRYAPAPEAYHHWYYGNVISKIFFMGVWTEKYVTDLWTYQEIIYGIKPSLIVEFGTSMGGSTLYLAEMLKLVNPQGLVYTVDIEDLCVDKVKNHPLVQFKQQSSTSLETIRDIYILQRKYPGRMFVVLDSDHSKDHVLAEMELLRDFTNINDYLIVEDSDINGHPVYANWGEGPYEAIEEYFIRHPEDYIHDLEAENKFGFTSAVNGFLVRNKL